MYNVLVNNFFIYLIPVSIYTTTYFKFLWRAYMSLVNVTPAKGLFRNAVWYFRKLDGKSCFVKVLSKHWKLFKTQDKKISKNFFLPGDLVLYCPSISRFVHLFHQSDKKFTNYSYRELNVNSFYEWFLSQSNSKFLKLLARAYRRRI